MNFNVVIVVLLTGRAGYNCSQGEEELPPEPFLFRFCTRFFAGLIRHGMKERPESGAPNGNLGRLHCVKNSDMGLDSFYLLNLIIKTLVTGSNL